MEEYSGEIHPPAMEHPDCNYSAVLIQHEDGPWYFCNKCGWGADAAEFGS